MEERKLLLDLSTDEFVANIKIDDIVYGLFAINKLSIIQRQKITGLGQSLVGVSNIKTVKDENKYDNILLDFLDVIIPNASKKHLSKLSISQKLDTINAYMDVSELTKKKVTQLDPGTRAKKKRN